MRPHVALALIVFALSSFFIQTLPAAQVLVVSSNGKWDMEYDGDPYGNVNALAAKALAACKAKGGTDPKIVWWQAINIFGADARIAHGAVALSDNGAGTIVGWCFNHPHQNTKRAREDCRRKGGHNPKVVAIF
jgi:hypothetical protein